MDEKEEYLKDQAASRAELNEAIREYTECFANTQEGWLWKTPNLVHEKEAALNALLDTLYLRLYLAECPF